MEETIGHGDPVSAGGASADVLIIGAGPAGLFCADALATNGLSVWIVEAGHEIDKRFCPASATCDCSVCSVLEGTGGAGGFSDGKMTYSLTRGTQMETLFDAADAPLMDFIDDCVVRFGGPGRDFRDTPAKAWPLLGTRLMFETYPLRHIGSDGARRWTAGMAADLRKRGVALSTDVEADSPFAAKAGPRRFWAKVRRVGSPHWVVSPIIRADAVVIATGLAGSGWVEDNLAHLRGDQRAASIGLRFETESHRLRPFFDRFYDFKLHMHDGPFALRTFCCNDCGSITPERHRRIGLRNVNGHCDLSAPTGMANFSIQCRIPLGGLTALGDDPREVARNIGIRMALRNGLPVVQGAWDFVAGRKTPEASLNELAPGRTYRAAGAESIHAHLPRPVATAFRRFLIELERAAPGVLEWPALLYGPEVKYHAMPIDVDPATFETRISKQYVVGNATGRVDSFVAAAMTGIKAARAIARR